MMIDYEKLKDAEILQEIHSTLSLLIKVMAAGHNQIAAKLDLMIPSPMREPDFEQQREISAPIDTSSSGKIKIGQKFWTLDYKNLPCEVEVVGVMGADVDLAFPDGSCKYGFKKHLYLTKKELIRAQLKFWQDLDHEFENDFAKDPRPRFEKAFKPKCKKCGEFYK